MRKNCSFIIKCQLCFTSLFGVLLSLIRAKEHGYFPWWTRLLYFTAQSNLWIGITTFIILCLPLFKTGEKVRARLYTLRFVFTVSIMLTGVIYCALLAPFADESYHVWSPSGLLTHVFTPLLALADFFVDKESGRIENKHLFYATAAPSLYILIASGLCIANVDFGRGVAYPYFFMNYRSSVGLFGVGGTPPFFLGSAYWIALFGGVSVLLAWVLKKMKRT